MTRTQNYLRAYRQIATRREVYSCHAIGRAKNSGNYKQTPAVVAYQAVFAPGQDEYTFLHRVNIAAGSSMAEAKNIRLLMLSLMAVCWRDFE